VAVRGDEPGAQPAATIEPADYGDPDSRPGAATEATLGNISAFAPRASGPAAEAASPPPFSEGASPRPVSTGDLSVHPVRFPPLPENDQMMSGPRSIDLLMDVSMRVSVELGRSRLTVEEVLQLGPGSVVELDKLAGEPVDILVNERLVARGEVVVVDENFGVRVTEIVSPRQRATAMGRAR
jgi:flagellar motor switch protein FliN/FliY